MSRFGYLVALLYLSYSGFALYSLKGITWLLVSLLGPLAFFPIWAYFLLGYSEPGVWIMFIYLLLDSNLNFTKKKNKNLKINDDSIRNIQEEKTINPEIDELEGKLKEISEEEKISELRNQLNQKRIERGLLSLSDFEKLEIKIKDLQTTYQKKIRSRNFARNKFNYLKPRRNIGTIILILPAGYSFYSMTNSGIPAFIAGLIFWVLGMYYFYYLNKKIKFFINKSEILTSEIQDLEIEIDKNSDVLNKNIL